MVRDVYCTRPRRAMASTVRSGSDASSTLPAAIACIATGRPVMSGIGVRFGPSIWQMATDAPTPSKTSRLTVSCDRLASCSSSDCAMVRRSRVRSADCARRMMPTPSRKCPVSRSCSTRPRRSNVERSRLTVDLCRSSAWERSVTEAAPSASPRLTRRAAARSTDRTAASSPPGTSVALSRKARSEAVPGSNSTSGPLVMISSAFTFTSIWSRLGPVSRVGIWMLTAEGDHHPARGDPSTWAP